VTNRRKPTQRPTAAAWKPTRPRSELYTAIGAACGVLLLTVLVIFLIKPADSTTLPSTPAVTTPAGSTDTTVPAATGSLPSESTTSTTTPAQP
jgi:hypothetical protein